MPRSMLVGLLVAASLPAATLAQSSGTPAIDLPNRFAPAASFGQLPPGEHAAEQPRRRSVPTATASGYSNVAGRRSEERIARFGKRS
jgi:hypothetical protein